MCGGGAVLSRSTRLGVTDTTAESADGAPSIWLRRRSTQAAPTRERSPATKVLLDDPGFRGAEVPFFPGSKPNEVFADMSKAVRPGWQYLPFQVYANSVFKDSVGQALQPGGNLPAALATWQDRLKAYGKEQGFTVK